MLVVRITRQVFVIGILLNKVMEASHGFQNHLPTNLRESEGERERERFMRWGLRGIWGVVERNTIPDGGGDDKRF